MRANADIFNSWKLILGSSNFQIVVPHEEENCQTSSENKVLADVPKTHICSSIMILSKYVM